MICPDPTPLATSTTLHVEGLNRWFDTADGQPKHVLKDISFSAAAGELLVIRGPNGSGKSTLMNLVAGLDEPSSGRILVNGFNPTISSVGYLFQDYSGSMLPWMTLGENATLPLKLKGVPPAHRREALRVLAEDARLNPLPFDQYPFQCSGGQQQKACFLRSLLTSEDILIMDEPFASLDKNSKDKFFKKLNQVRLAARTLVLLVVHDLDDAILLADRILCLDGSPASIQDIVHVDLPWPRAPDMLVQSDFLAVRKRVLETFSEIRH